MNNREIKFRAWDKAMKEMIFTGFHVFGEVTCFSMMDQWVHENPCKTESSLDRWDDIILMQFTGLYDINKVQVYEGDIVTAKTITGKVHKNFFKVIWDIDTASFYMDNGKDGDAHFAVPMTGLLDINEVVGNIFQNPELLFNVSSL